MTLSYKARRRWSLFILLVGMPAYVVIAVTLVNALERPSILVELLVYVVLGVAWVLPFRFVFRGIGKPDPGADPEAGGTTSPSASDDPADRQAAPFPEK